MPKEEILDINLPKPKQFGSVSLEEVIANRKSVRNFSSSPLSIGQLSQLLWSCYGFTNLTSARRTIPSAGAIYPLQIYIAVGKDAIPDIEEGLYSYNPKEHSVTHVMSGDIKFLLYSGCNAQDCVQTAPICIIICADYDKMKTRYGRRAKRYTKFEVGHAGQNIYLQAAALNLSTVAVGAFDDECLEKLLKLGKKIKPLYIFPVGRPAL